MLVAILKHSIQHVWGNALARIIVCRVKRGTSSGAESFDARCVSPSWLQTKTLAERSEATHVCHWISLIMHRYSLDI